MTTTPALNDDLAKDRADWLLDAVACATQDRRFLRGEPEYDDVAGDAILMNGEKAIRVALEAQSKEIEALRSAHGILNEAVEIIAGERHCADNLMGNAEVAIDALRRIRALRGA